MPITLNGDTGITTPSYGGVDVAEYLVPVTAFKNRIINGAMMIDQRNAGASVTIGGATVTYTLDRWFTYGTLASKFSVQQNAGSVTPPTGFSNYLGITSLAATTPSASDEYVLGQRIEGFNFYDMAWGTASAQSITLSFWVRSSLTGTFGGSVGNNATNRSYVFSYTINAANTWEQKTITIAGDTTGTWIGATNGIALRLTFDLGAGTTYKGTAGSWSSTYYDGVTGGTNIIGTNGATFYITGVQLEKGSTATSFDYRPYGTELQLCQRYYFNDTHTVSSGLARRLVAGYMYSSTQWEGMYFYPVEMRVAPTITFTAANTFTINNALTVSSISGYLPNTRSTLLYTGNSAGIVGQGAGLWTTSTNGTVSNIQFSAEL